MDIITHGLAGVLVAQAGFAQRIGRPALIALTASAMLPDLDVVMRFVDELAVGRYQRGLTHAFACTQSIRRSTPTTATGT